MLSVLKQTEQAMHRCSKGWAYHFRTTSVLKIKTVVLCCVDIFTWHQMIIRRDHRVVLGRSVQLCVPTSLGLAVYMRHHACTGKEVVGYIYDRVVIIIVGRSVAAAGWHLSFASDQV